MNDPSVGDAIVEAGGCVLAAAFVLTALAFCGYGMFEFIRGLV